MGYPTRSEIQAVLSASYDLAIEGLQNKTQGQVKLAEVMAKSMDRVRRSPRYGVCHSEQLAILSVDVRKSSQMAESHSVETIFKVFQCFVPCMAFLTEKMDGEVVSLRGDGLLGAFGFDVKTYEECVKASLEAGLVMIEATETLINPFFVEKKLGVELSVGVGIDIGEVVLTKIGVKSANEVTAYGAAVNCAAKNSKGVNNVWLSSYANRQIEEGGKAKYYKSTHSRIIKG